MVGNTDAERLIRDCSNQPRRRRTADHPCARDNPVHTKPLQIYYWKHVPPSS